MDGYFLVGPAAYATREAWQHWIDGALAFNPLAKATPKKKKKTDNETRTKRVSSLSESHMASG